MKGKAFLFPRLFPHPHPKRRDRSPHFGAAQGPLPHGLPDGGTAAGHGTGLRSAPQKGRIRPSRTVPMGGKAAGQRRGSRFRGHTAAAARCGRPAGRAKGCGTPPAARGPGSPPLRGRGGAHGHSEGARGSTSPRGAHAPLPPSPPRPPRLMSWLPPPAAALPDGTG